MVKALLRRSRVVPCGTAGALAGVLRIFWLSVSGGVGAGCSPQMLLSFGERGSWVIPLGVVGTCGSLCGP